MGTVFITILAAVSAGYACYRTIQGYRTGVLKLRETFDRRTAPRMFFLMLVLMTVLSLVTVGAVAMMIYGQTHPDWPRARAKQAEYTRTSHEASLRIDSHAPNTTWREPRSGSRRSP